MSVELHPFWSELETSVHIGGPRGWLQHLMGEGLVRELERLDVLAYRRAARSYPCDGYVGDRCPRRVFQRRDGTAVAVCGNPSPQCAELELRAPDIDVLGFQPYALAVQLSKALRFRLKVEGIEDLNAFRIGTFVPEPGVEHRVYFLRSSSEREYSVAVDALRVHAAGATLIVLVPTHRYVSETLHRHAAAAGIPLLSLDDIIWLDETGGLRSHVDPLRLFASAGRAGRVVSPSHYVARALVRDADGHVGWRHLDEQGYQQLLRDVAAYDVVADERTGTVRRYGGQEVLENVSSGQFRWIRAAVESRRHYDPGTGDGEGVAAKQLFQRARRVFDLKAEQGWSIFQTEMVDNHAVYSFAPRGQVTFAYVFTAVGPTGGAIERELTPLEVPHGRSWARFRTL